MIKAYSSDDFQQCCELFMQVFNGSPWFDKWTVDSARAHIKELTDSKRFLGFTAWDNDIVGAVLAYKRTFYNGIEIYIEDLFVAPDYQHRGFGSALMYEVERYAKINSAISITLITGVGKPSYDFFKKFGCKHLDSLAFMHKSIE
jgi:GNAT superfamily N-acetyltransferase